MPRSSFLLFIGLFLALPAFGSTNFVTRSARPTSVQAPLEPPLGSYRVGEKLVFDVFWFGFHVGMGSLEIKEKILHNGRPAYHVVALAKTNDFLSKLYPVEDEVHSFIDAEGLYALEFRKTLREGSYRADERIVFDHAKKKGYYESFRNQSKKEIDIPAGVHDLVSAFYWFRLQPVEMGKSIHTLVSSDEKNWDLEIEVIGREKKQFRKHGAIDTIVIEPKSRLKGVLYQRGRAFVYFSTSSDRSPVWVTFKTPYGAIHGVLKDYPASVRIAPLHNETP